MNAKNPSKFRNNLGVKRFVGLQTAETLNMAVKSILAVHGVAVNNYKERRKACTHLYTTNMIFKNLRKRLFQFTENGRRRKKPWKNVEGTWAGQLKNATRGLCG
jgi:hypothetical protein